MIPPFDIFRVLKNGEPMWIESANNLDAAKERVQQLGDAEPGEYLVFSQKTSHKISIIVEGGAKSQRRVPAESSQESSD